jgi:dTMP kinase
MRNVSSQEQPPLSGKQGRFIVVEGIDGAGKSTVASSLSANVDISCLETPQQPFLTIKQQVLEQAAPLARLLYFMAANAQMSETVSALVNIQDVVLIRYVWSTVAYHAAIERLKVDEVLPVCDPLIHRVKMPDLVVFLDVDREVQKLRLKDRIDDKLQTVLGESDDFHERLKVAYQDAFSAIQVPHLVVDTTKHDAPYIAQVVQELLHNPSSR